jgi:diguanylate cyclase (GGDEF)-like protein
MDNEQPELSSLQLRNIQILTHLYQHDAISDDIVELLRETEIDYFSLLDKYKLLEQVVNLDEKTRILKFKSDYLTQIIKTASRVYYGIQAATYHISLVRFDIDDFSVFNNRYGHDVGDTVLIEIAGILKDNSRPTDYVIRFGGEEFDVILPSTDLPGAEIYINKIFSEVARLKVPFNGEQLSVTLSAGISHVLYHFSSSPVIDEAGIESIYRALQSEADNALYEAKYNGKNRFCVYSSEKSEMYTEVRKKYCKTV